MPDPKATRHNREDKVYHATCKYCGREFEYYVREDSHENCMRESCIQAAIRDGVYKNFRKQ